MNADDKYALKMMALGILLICCIALIALAPIIVQFHAQ